MHYKVEEARRKLIQKICDVVEGNQGRRKILVVKWPPGIGKTYTTSKLLFSRNNTLTIWLGPNHKQIIKDVENKLEKQNIQVFHLRGRNRPDMCINTQLLERIPNRSYINEHTICRTCEYFTRSECPYYNQFEELRRNPQSWVGVHHHLQTGFLFEYINNENFGLRCLVIDEYFIDNLKKDVKFDTEDLLNLMDLIKDICKRLSESGNFETNFVEPSRYQLFMQIACTLVRILVDTTRDGITGLDFVNLFFKYLEEDKFEVDEIRKRLFKESMDNFINNDFYPELIGCISNNVPIKNILEELLEITRICFRIHDDPPDHDINLPFFSEKREEEYYGKKKYPKFIQYSRLIKDLPEVPIIILDATGDAELYRRLFNCEVEEFTIDIEIDRNIVQIMDAMYWKSSLKNKDTRIRVFRAISYLVKKHLKNENIVDIITYKNYKKGLKKFLFKTGIDTSNIRFAHFGNIKGINEMENDNTLIILGTYEPNIKDYPKQVALWYEDEKPISIEKINEVKGSKFYCHDYRYKDPRYFAHVRMKREHEIEQAIERLRFLYDDNREKTVYLFSMLPISFKTKKVRLAELMEQFSPIYVMRAKLKELRRKPDYVYLSHIQDGKDKLKDIKNKVRNIIPFRDNRTWFDMTKNAMQESKFVVEREGFLFLTEKGKKKLKEYEDEISILEDDLDSDY